MCISRCDLNDGKSLYERPLIVSVDTVSAETKKARSLTKKYEMMWLQ